MKILGLVDNDANSSFSQCSQKMFSCQSTNYFRLKVSFFQGKAEDALKAFENLVNKYPQSPRARYGKAQVKSEQTKW